MLPTMCHPDYVYRPLPEWWVENMRAAAQRRLEREKPYLKTHVTIYGIFIPKIYEIPCRKLAYSLRRKGISLRRISDAIYAEIARLSSALEEERIWRGVGVSKAYHSIDVTIPRVVRG